MEVKKTDADIIWVTNMIDAVRRVPPQHHELLRPRYSATSVWTSTSNGVDYEAHVDRRQAPNAPSLIVLDKKTGALLGEEAVGAQPAHLPQQLVVTRLPEDGRSTSWRSSAGPDGWHLRIQAGAGEGRRRLRSILQEAWRFDCNPQGLPQVRTDGNPPQVRDPQRTERGARDAGGLERARVYTAIGQDPEHGEGVGNLTCIDANGKEVWSYRKINRSMTTLSIVDDLVFVADYSGFVYCLDANTGKEYWKHDTSGHIWGSTLVADGKVFVGSEDGFLTVIPATKKYDQSNVKEIDMTSPIYSSPIVAQGVLYVATHTHLFAIKTSEAGESNSGDKDDK